MILKQGHTYRAMPHDGKVIRRIYRGGRCYYIASPYSPEATQALKAAFPAYWTAIRDYGYAHPQLVPFINEDPMLIVSLVEVGKTRWLVGDGSAYFNMGYVPVGDDVETYTKFIVTEQGQAAKGIFGKGSYNSQTNSIYISTWFNSSYKNLVMHGVTTAQGAWLGDTAGNKVDYTWELTQILKDGVYNAISLADGIPKADGWAQAKEATPLVDDGVPCYLFKTSTYDPFKGMIAEHYEKENGVLSHHFLPFRRNGQMEMLDIVTLTLATRVGTFTEIIEDKPNTHSY